MSSKGTQHAGCALSCPARQSPPPHTLLQHTSLATSLAGNTVDLLTITAAHDRGKPLAQRQGVVLSGARTSKLSQTTHTYTTAAERRL